MDRLKLAQGLRSLPASAREDLAGREEDIQRGKTVELLRRAGKEMYENPIVNTAIGLAPVAGDIQAGVEAYRSAREGDWGNAGLNAVGMLPFIPMLGKTVWHGSPHTFDKFDLSKIGTGEGAQSYGHGLYLAEAKPTAQKYAQDLSSETFRVGNEVFDPNTLQHLNVRTQARSGNVDEAINKALQLSQSDSPVANLARQDLEVLQNIKEQGGMVPNEGQLYKVDLPDEQIAKMLDWDKPLSEQPESVRNALLETPALKKIRSKMPNAWDSLSGENIYREMSIKEGAPAILNNYEGSPESASAYLNQIGIPGIQYLDQASRGAGEGTRNYVVFSDEIPQILERNNQPLVNALRNKSVEQLESLNPTGTVMTEYNPTQRATMPLGKNLTTLDVTMGANPDEMVTIYRGVPSGVSEISPGDFITTNERLAKDYAGTGKVISQKVPARTVLDDLTEPLGEEYIYRP